MNIEHNLNAGIKTDGHDIDRNLATQLDSAEGVISKYVETDTLAQRSKIELSAIVADKAAQAGLDMSDSGDAELAVRSIQNVLKERAVNEMTRLDRVVLDLDGSYGSQTWLATDVPSIVFCAVKSADKAIARHSGGNPVRAIAVYFDPALAGTREYTRPDGTSVQRPNQYEPSAYTSIVGTFGSVADAESARNELANAVRTVARPVTDSATEADPVREAITVKRSAVLDTL
jgi:hypothetical protein